jgi:N-acetylneuraminate synthase
MNDYKTFVIAEIGCNHKGDMETAKELIKIAKIFYNVDAVKFQKEIIEIINRGSIQCSLIQ